MKGIMRENNIDNAYRWVVKWSIRRFCLFWIVNMFFINVLSVKRLPKDYQKFKAFWKV